MVLPASFWFYNVIKTIGKTEKEDETFVRKTEEKQNSVFIMTYVAGKGTAFPVNLELEGESFE